MAGMFLVLTLLLGMILISLILVLVVVVSDRLSRRKKEKKKREKKSLAAAASASATTTARRQSSLATNYFRDAAMRSLPSCSSSYSSYATRPLPLYPMSSFSSAAASETIYYPTSVRTRSSASCFKSFQRRKSSVCTGRRTRRGNALGTSRIRENVSDLRAVDPVYAVIDKRRRRDRAQRTLNKPSRLSRMSYDVLWTDQGIISASSTFATMTADHSQAVKTEYGTTTAAATSLGYGKQVELAAAAAAVNKLITNSGSSLSAALKSESSPLEEEEEEGDDNADSLLSPSPSSLMDGGGGRGSQVYLAESPISCQTSIVPMTRNQFYLVVQINLNNGETKTNNAAIASSSSSSSDTAASSEVKRQEEGVMTTSADLEGDYGGSIPPQFPPPPPSLLIDKIANF